ncbi:MAG: hypothetical protein AB9900_01745 [Humidesulfovibrio sp.]
MIEHIANGQRLLAIHIRPEPGPEGIRFFTPGDTALQCGEIVRPAGFVIPAHAHAPLERRISVTQEVLIFQGGRVRADFFDEDGAPVCSREMAAGDVLCLLSGGHGFTVLEDAHILEVKQGPYLGEHEKRRFPELREDGDG